VERVEKERSLKEKRQNFFNTKTGEVWRGGDHKTKNSAPKNLWVKTPTFLGGRRVCCFFSVFCPFSKHVKERIEPMTKENCTRKKEK
jgi:hypothetical protein